jgi:hypothetical protein
MAVTRIYLVRNKTTGALALVESAHPSTALRHVASTAFDVQVASAKEVADLMTAGAKVANPGEEQLLLPEIQGA